MTSLTFKLSAALAGHAADVRAVVAPYNDTIVSASRDRTVRVWTKQGLWVPSVNFASSGYVNTLAFDITSTSIISGGQDKLVSITDLYNSGEDSADAKYVLVGHESNVCSLHTDGKEIISGSWDTTAKVWENHILKYTLEGHSASVWDVKILGDERYLTCSADRTVKLWHKNKEIKTFVGHKEAVRALAILPDGAGFVSVSNDCTARVTTFEGVLIQELVGHESFIYSVALLSNGDFVTCGEDRTVRIWRNGKAIQVITLPCVSVWSVSVQPNDDIVTGSSDGVVRIFSRDPDRYASDGEIAEFNEAVEGMALNAQSFDESKVADASALDKPGSKEGQVIVVKSSTGINEAYQWSEGKWTKIGEVVSGSTSDQKHEFDGKKWDFVFDVDIQEGAPPLKLPYNTTENPYVAATRFLEKNELPLSYTEQIVEFISKNTQGVTISQSSEIVDPYADKRRSKLIPHTEYLGFTSNNYPSILKGIKKFNATEKTYDESQLASIETAFKNNDITQLSKVAQEIIEKWDTKLPGFDIFRIIVSQLDTPPELIAEVFDKGLVSSSPASLFLTLRSISNIFLNGKWGEPIITDVGIATRILNVVGLLANFGDDKNVVNVANAMATVILNYSIYASKYKSSKIATLVADTLKSYGATISGVSSEAAYRSLVAYGNLIYIDSSLKRELGSFKSVIKYDEQRFRDVIEDIEAL